MQKSVNKKQKANKIIKILKSKNVPTDGLEYFTVGDRSLPHLLKLQKEILELNTFSSELSFLETIIQGDFGTGKTHFIKYLRHLLERDATQNIIISEISFRDIRKPDDFYSLIIQNMNLIGWQKVNSHEDILKYCYSEITKDFQSSILDKNEIKQWFSILLYYLLGKATGGLVNQDLIKILRADNLIEKTKEYLTKIRPGAARRGIRNTLRDIEKNATSEEKQFVGQYIEIIDYFDTIDQANLGSTARQATQVLTSDRQLLTIIFKILNLAKVNTIVILIDELETLNSSSQEILRQTLDRVTDFRDKYPEQRDSNLSFALICASTGNFLSEMEAHNPALYSRWKDKVIQLEAFSPSDIDNLIFKLRDLYFLAGKNLSPIRTPANQDNHQLIDMRNSLLEEYSDPGALNARDIIAKLIDKIDSTWAR